MTKAEAIGIISKALEMADIEYISEAYMAAVDCLLCPVKEECYEGTNLCRNFIAEKIKEEEEQHV